jgi:hypothetical protein
MWQRGVRLSRFRSRIVYATIWPGPWKVVWPPRSVGWYSALAGVDPDGVSSERIGSRGGGSERFNGSGEHVLDGGRSRRPVV